MNSQDLQTDHTNNFSTFIALARNLLLEKACFRTKKPDQDNDESVFFVVIIRVMSAEDIRTFNQDEKS